MARTPAPRLRRLGEELEESGLPPTDDERYRAVLLEEVDQALRPVVHERRVASSGTIVDPGADPGRWAAGTELRISRTPVKHEPLLASRRFVDGLSSWLLRDTSDERYEWLLFDRPAGSERDLVVLADAMDATIVQRHPIGTVRVVGGFGVLRWTELSWHLELPVATWVDIATAEAFTGDRAALEAMLRFAVHDLGSMGIGALLIYRPDDRPEPPIEQRLPKPPPLRIRSAVHLAPLRHALAQVDGAAVFDGGGTLRQLGVRLVPSATAERAISPLEGTRHTSALRYSHDDPSATVVVVSEDGPVTVLRNGAVLGRSAG